MLEIDFSLFTVLSIWNRICIYDVGTRCYNTLYANLIHKMQRLHDAIPRKVVKIKINIITNTNFNTTTFTMNCIIIL